MIYLFTLTMSLTLTKYFLTMHEIILILLLTSHYIMGFAFPSLLMLLAEGLKHFFTYMGLLNSNPSLVFKPHQLGKLSTIMYCVLVENTKFTAA